MNEKELVIKYLDGINKLEEFYSKRNKKIDEYVSIWRSLEAGDEVEQLRFIFNNEPGKMSKYIGVIDYLNDTLISQAVSEKESFNKEKQERELFLKNYLELFAGYNKSDYLNDKELSNDSKELAEIYFGFKDIEGELYSWLKKTQRRLRFSDLTKMGIFIWFKGVRKGDA